MYTFTVEKMKGKTHMDVGLIMKIAGIGILVAVAPGHYAFSVSLVVTPVSFVSVFAGPCIRALSALFVFDPVALVFLSIG